MSKTTPVRWWRDDATRYQSRPLVGVCRSWALPVEEFIWDSPRPLDPELLRTLDAYFEAARPERIAAASAIPLELITPIEFVRLEPVPWSAEQDAELQRRLAEAHANGWRQPEPVFLLCTLAGQSIEESI